MVAPIVPLSRIAVFTLSLEEKKATALVFCPPHYTELMIQLGVSLLPRPLYRTNGSVEDKENTERQATTIKVLVFLCFSHFVIRLKSDKDRKKLRKQLFPPIRTIKRNLHQRHFNASNILI
jgi:hypothetical protein